MNKTHIFKLQSTKRKFSLEKEKRVEYIILYFDPRKDKDKVIFVKSLKKKRKPALKVVVVS